VCLCMCEVFREGEHVAGAEHRTRGEGGGGWTSRSSTRTREKQPRRRRRRGSSARSGRHASSSVSAVQVLRDTAAAASQRAAGASQPGEQRLACFLSSFPCGLSTFAACQQRVGTRSGRETTRGRDDDRGQGREAKRTCLGSSCRAWAPCPWPCPSPPPLQAFLLTSGATCARTHQFLSASHAAGPSGYGRAPPKTTVTTDRSKFLAPWLGQAGKSGHRRGAGGGRD